MPNQCGHLILKLTEYTPQYDNESIKLLPCGGANWLYAEILEDIPYIGEIFAFLNFCELRLSHNNFSRKNLCRQLLVGAVIVGHGILLS